MPEDPDYELLAEQWVSVANLVKEEYGAELDQSLEALGLLQRILDENLLDPTNTFGLQCLGVALGKVMATNIAGLGWWIVEDELGNGPCLRYRETTLRLNPVTMISKRVERGEAVSVRGLFNDSVRELARLGDDVD